MTWTREQKLAALLRLPWTIRVERDVDEGYIVARIGEIPSAIATGDTEAELERDLWESLRMSLQVYLDHDDEIPLPVAAKGLPWELKPPAQRVRAIIVARRRGEAWDAFDVSDAFDADTTALTGDVRRVEQYCA